ncbi:fimbrial biogenesis chaperone [Enterovibrio coralii]|uniref:Pilus assembly protein n=1 Tax=Enterovibrio coralii TaxID=294935 RepID=A0A135I6N5_9GAMM|nr:molecular chaperone [Enterovibrio coralii]KXF81112.1 pilus assembly protein [Enterovibrio coralii]
MTNLFGKVLGFLVLIFPTYLIAYQVTPMIAEMTPLGRGAQLSMRVDNTNDFPLTVELVPLKLSMDRFGQETLSSADDDLLVIPVTAVIEPGKSQSVLVRYIGDPEIKNSNAYRISVRQVNVLGSQNDIGLLMRFDTLMNVKPEKASPSLSVIKVSEGNNGWFVEVKNDGDSYGRITESIWTIKQGGKSVVVRGRDIQQYVTGTLVLPKSSRVFPMKPINGFSPSKTSIEIVELK